MDPENFSRGGGVSDSYLSLQWGGLDPQWPISRLGHAVWFEKKFLEIYFSFSFQFVLWVVFLSLLISSWHCKRLKINFLIAVDSYYLIILPAIWSALMARVCQRFLFIKHNGIHSIEILHPFSLAISFFFISLCHLVHIFFPE